jgi:hypothetical protein
LRSATQEKKAGFIPESIMINTQKFTKTSNCWGVMEVVGQNAYDLKFISAPDLSYNPALGTG